MPYDEAAHRARILDHLVWIAQLDLPAARKEAWVAAKQYAEIDPYALADMPERLTERMKELDGKPNP